MHQVRSLPPGCITRGQDSQQLRTLGLTKIGQHENSTIHTNINAVCRVTIQTEFPQFYTYITYLLWHFFFNFSTALAELYLLIFKAS
jgi:hypothetical protein